MGHYSQGNNIGQNTSTTDWQMAARQDNVACITLCKSINVDFLIRSANSQSSSYPIVITRLSEPRFRRNPNLKFLEG